MDRTMITVEIAVDAPIEKVWRAWNMPEDIMQWNNTSDEWHTPRVDNDLRPGGKFLFAMGLKDGSLNFDFTGTYDEVKTNELISYTLDDGRIAKITFAAGSPVKIIESFEPESSMANDVQRDFCQAVLDSFKKYTESKPD